MSDRHPNANAPFSESGSAVAEDGVVLLDGPDGVAVSMTPDAAEETGNRLIEAARMAREQSRSNPQAEKTKRESC